MPKGIPVATIAIGNAENAGLLAVKMLASRDPELTDKYGSLLLLLFACKFVVLNDASATVCSRPLVISASRACLGLVLLTLILQIFATA
jgi:hypothetical protein